MEGSFIVDVSEPKPNRPNTMNLVEKRAQELGICEDFVNGWAGLLESRIIKKGRGRVKVCPRASSEDEFFFSSSNTTRLELSGVFRTAIPLFGWPLVLFIFLFRSSSSYTCQSSRLILECTSPQPFFLAFCEQLWPPSHCPGVTSTSTGSEC